MGHRSHPHNKDYYTVAGRSGGPAGPLHQFKDKLSKEQATIRRDVEGTLPSERRVTGARKKRR